MKDDNHIIYYPLKIVLVTLDFLVMIITFGWVKALRLLLLPTPLRSIPIEPDKPHHRLHTTSKNNNTTLLQTTETGERTIHDLMKRSYELYPTFNAFGTRKYLGQYDSKRKHFGRVEWWTYEEIREKSYRFGAALIQSGLVPSREKGSIDRITTSCSVAIFENTCREWMIAALGAFSQSIVVTTVYATLGMDAVIDAINDGSIRAIVCNKNDVNHILENVKKMPTLRTIIYTNNMIPIQDIDRDDDFSQNTPKDIKVIPFKSFLQSANPLTHPPTPPRHDTTAVIMYTSGSTGKPKGVVITHGNIVAGIASGLSLFGSEVKAGDDVYIGYLPLAHILEMMAEFLFLSMGCAIAYADPKTLSSVGAYPMGALEQFEPSIMFGVPKVYDVIKKGVEAKVEEEPKGWKRFLVKMALEVRSKALDRGYDCPVLGRLVFGEFRRKVGGRLRFVLSGGGALNKEVQRFFRTCFGCPLFQGYGLTETCANLAFQDPFLDTRTNIAGCPLPSVEVKLISTPPDILDKSGLPYRNTDTVDDDGNLIHGRGEICVRGHNVGLGYYMQPELTKEVWDEDGFFHTGDIGQFMMDGSLRIVDRKKNLVKLKGGEYVALEKMESAYNNSKFVDGIKGGICCYGDADMDRPIALMQLNEVYAVNYAKENGIEGDLSTLKCSVSIMKAVEEDMAREADKAGLSRLERLAGIVFVSGSWTPENGCLTAANKLQRRKVIEVFRKEYEETRLKGIF